MAHLFQLYQVEFLVQSSLQYIVKEHSSIILSICAQKPLSEIINCEADHFLIADGSNHRLLILDISEPATVNIQYEATSRPMHRIINNAVCPELPVSQLGAAVLPYLYPSRYCPSDRLTQFATNRFDKYDNEFEKVLAVNNWIYENVEYISGSTDSGTSASDIILQQTGVCRDFAHLGITLCRALSIPARYCSAYAYQLDPQDFHACFEAFLGSEWIVFDATGKAPLNGLIKIAHGRDAADTAVASLYGDVSGTQMDVIVKCLTPDFTPYFYMNGSTEGISLE